jgi:hypothetical protein
MPDDEEFALTGDLELTTKYLYAFTYNSSVIKDDEGNTETVTIPVLCGYEGYEIKELFDAEDVAAIFGEIVGVEFKYWTAEEPDEEGSYIAAPEEFEVPATITEDTTLYAYWTPIIPLVTIQPGLNLLSEIGINFYFTLAEGENPDDYSVDIEYQSWCQEINETYAFSDLTPSNGEYKLTALSVGSDEMSYPVAVTVWKGEEVVASEVHTVAWIAEDWLEDGEHEQYATLLKAMLQYGHYAEIEFNHNAGATLVPAGAPKLVAIPDEYAVGDDPTTLADYVAKFDTGLTLDSSVGMNTYIKPVEGYGLEDFEIKATNAAGKSRKIVGPQMAGKEIKTMLKGIYPDQMTDAYNFIVTVDGKTATYTRSVMNCAYEIQKKGGYFNLLTSLYQYCLAAKDIWGGK